jgi:hypothetical protein
MAWMVGYPRGEEDMDQKGKNICFRPLSQVDE